MKTLLLLLTVIGFVACGGSNSIGEPPIKPGEVGITIGTMPDSVEVGTSLEFTLKAAQENQKENFTFSADTTGAFNMTVNTFAYKEVTTLIPDKENNIKITPTKAGVCKVKFSVGKDKQTQKEVQVKAYAVPVQIEVSAIPDSISVFDNTEFTFQVNGKQGETYNVKIDTVVPFFYMIRTFYDDGDLLLKDKRYGAADIQVNGMAIDQIKEVVSGEKNTIKFKNPTVVGEYKILLSVTDKYGSTTKQAVSVRAFSPEIVVKFYEIDPGFDEEEYFEDLNRDYTYNPLSNSLKGKRVDVIYSQVEWQSVQFPDGTHGYDSVTTTIPGRGIICYIGQEGGGDMQHFEGWDGFLRGEDKQSLSTTGFATSIDGVTYWERPIKQGFHGVVFETSTGTKVGVMYYTLRMVDKWGREKMETITVKNLEMNETKPETGHILPD